ncbi:hypothetical protein AVEN_37623-1 [Araneus ventricosus]|uniref:Uncharacterized protein n=1 Tax=Araneus ventricosus TaxID=182803 RepID=A0A4Y2K190_ARAVE|nr:hypothetical protein AVEN_37623-1 [Araneus ventricosus]
MLRSHCVFSHHLSFRNENWRFSSSWHLYGNEILGPNFLLPYVTNETYLTAANKSNTKFAGKETEVEWYMINYGTSLYLRPGYDPKESSFGKNVQFPRSSCPSPLSFVPFEQSD